MVLTAVLSLTALELGAQPLFNPHGDPVTGVLREATIPSTRGECMQCHPVHAESSEPVPNPILLFTENDNRLPFWDQGDGPCHRGRPDNYPLTESDRLPDTEIDAGYFEANLGGIRRVGVEFRGRWPGADVYTDPGVTAGGHYHSPHAQDPDMPRQGPNGEGLCFNCHNPHGTPNPFDLLTAPYRSISGANSVGAPEAYRLCLSCHGADGPAGMDVESRLIEDYYDGWLNPQHGGHRINKSSDVAIYWPPHIQAGDMLPCYDCHNPHGSEGNNGVQPNAFVISDQRPGWSGLTDTINDAEQCRRFCLGCHIPSDGVAGTQEVEGILMNTLSSRGPHVSTSSRSCYDCHGRDYSSPTGFNVHNPTRNPGPGPGGDKPGVEPWDR
jgi:hypothetical protein